MAERAATDPEPAVDDRAVRLAAEVGRLTVEVERLRRANADQRATEAVLRGELRRTDSALATFDALAEDYDKLVEMLEQHERAERCTCGMEEQERTGHCPQHAEWCDVLDDDDDDEEFAAENAHLRATVARLEALADEWADTDWNAVPHLGCLDMRRYCAGLIRDALKARDV